MGWSHVRTPEFEKKFKKLKKDKTSQEIIKKGLEKIILDPYHNSKIYLERKLKVRRFGKWRIIFQPCEDCRLRKVDNIVACTGCEEYSDNTVFFFDFQLRKDDYK